MAPRRRPPLRFRLVGLCMAASLALLASLWAVPVLESQEPVEHVWRRIYYAPLDGQERLLFANQFDRARLAPGDLDGDGDIDLLVGTGAGQVMYFENQGTAKAPRWRLMNPAIGARRGRGTAPMVTLDVGDNAAPVLVDIDGDGDLDLFVGAADGRVTYLRNEGNKYLPTFRYVTPDYLGARVGLNVAVRFPDLNGDGLPDLSIGNEAGEFSYALNHGAPGNPRFCLQARSSPDCPTVLTRLGRLEPEDNAVPEWSDYDQDGDLDLFVGKSDGTVAHYQNIGSAREGYWELAESRFYILDGGGFAAPVFTDVTGDGVPDLLLAGDGEAVAYYTRRLKERNFTLWLEDRNVLQVGRLGGHRSRVHVAAGDLDADGDLDLVVGTRGGQLMVYENVGTTKAPAFRSPQAPLLPTPQRSFATPTLADVDGDGDLDLVVGGREGRLELIENVGDAKAARWAARTLFFAQVDVGNLSVPLFADVDGDKDLDLLVGNAVGQLVFYENTGAARDARFTLRTVRFGGLEVPSSASPALFDWDPKGPAHIVLGTQAGTLIPAVRNPALKVSERGAYQREPAWGGGLQAESYAAPTFADLSGDGRPDLLLGTGRGALLFWRYEGSAKPSQIAARQEERGSNVLEERPAITTPLSESGLTADAGAGEGREGATAALPPPEPAPPPSMEPIFVYEASTLQRMNLGGATKPAFFDANGDGRPDLVVGTRAGKLILLENGGDGNTWRRVTDTFAGYGGGRNAAPAFVDADVDGDLDLAVGNEDGRVLYWENVGSPRSPRFEQRNEPFALVRGGKNAVPAFADLNEDGRPDLLLGNLKGELLYYVNKAPLRFELEMHRFIGLDVGVNANPTVADLAAPKEPYLVVGSDQGQMRVFGTTGTSRLRSSGWKENPAYLEGMKMPLGSAAAFADIDGDGDVDMVVGSDEGPLRLFRNHARQAADQRATARR